MRRLKVFLVLLLSFVFFPLVSASTTTLSASQTNFNVQPGDSGSVVVSYSIVAGSGDSGANGVALTGTPRFISYSGSSLSYSENTTTTGTFTLQYSIPSNQSDGTFTNSVVVDSYVLNLNFIVSSPQTSDLIVFPTNKVITVKQGDEKTQSILITVPSNYPRVVNIQGVSFNPEVSVIHFGDLNIGQVSPGQSISIPIVFSTEDASVGTYQTVLNIFATDSQGQVDVPSVNLQLQISAGTNPITNDTFTQKPSCSLSATNLNLNSTYSLTCSNVVNNIEVSTPFNDYFVGTGYSLTSGLYTYTFKAVRTGVTEFLAYFTSQGSSLFEPFRQEVRITPSGSSVLGGTNMSIIFYQEGVKKNESLLSPGETNILVLDSVSGSTINLNNVNIYLNGNTVNNSFTLESDKDYELRVSAVDLGYTDEVLSLNVTDIPLNLSVSPLKSFYLVGEQVSFVSGIDGVSYRVNGESVGQNYTFTYPGNLIIQASKVGYSDKTLNITVRSPININAASPYPQDWSNGDEVFLDISESTGWQVYYSQAIDSNGQTTYADKVQIASGNGTRVSFKISGAGVYEVKSGELSIVSQEIKKSKFLGFLPDWRWWVWALIVLGIFIIARLLLGGKGSKRDDSFQFMGDLKNES